VMGSAWGIVGVVAGIWAAVLVLVVAFMAALDTFDPEDDPFDEDAVERRTRPLGNVTVLDHHRGQS
jgi:hypothetical protein